MVPLVDFGRRRDYLASDAMGARNSNGELACIVLAAGKGTRMRSARVKVLHPLLGRPLVSYPVNLARELGADPVVAVLGHQREAVEAALSAEFGEGTIRAVEQVEQRGTGHAVRLAMPALRRFAGIVVILYGDVPLLRRETVRALVGTARRYGCLALVTTSPPDPTGYGRILRDQRGHVIGVVEQKDASEEELAIGEINAGIYAAPADFLRTATAGLSARNAQGEYYLTDIVARAARTIGVSAVDADFRDVAGINDRRQLGESEAIMRARINGSWMRHVTFHDAASTVIEPGVTLGVDVELGQGVSLRGATRVGRGAHIDDGAVLIDTVVGPHARVAPYTVAFGAEIAAGALVGPLVSLGPAPKVAANGARNGAGAPTARLKRATRKSAVVRAR